MTYTLPSKLASITDECSGGFTNEITTPAKARDRNSALIEALEQLLIAHKRINELEIEE